MQIRFGYDIAFKISSPTAVMTLLRVHPTVEHDLIGAESPRVEPDVPASEFLDSYGNRVGRVLAPPGLLRFTNDGLIRVNDGPDPVVADAVQHEVSDLPDEALQFLLASRYCEVDRLGDIAWDLFGSSPPGWARVAAICDWVHGHVTFGYQYARSTKTAYDVYEEAKGVCRDFTHLAITLCRCMNIPARYATGYLGDIGVPLSPDPMDFSAWFEVYLGGTWHTFDARHNRPRIGRIVMARGRDAVDFALTTAFGSAPLEKFLVWTDRADGPDR